MGAKLIRGCEAHIPRQLLSVVGIKILDCLRPIPCVFSIHNINLSYLLHVMKDKSRAMSLRTYTALYVPEHPGSDSSLCGEMRETSAFLLLLTRPCKQDSVGFVQNFDRGKVRQPEEAYFAQHYFSLLCTLFLLSPN